MVEARWQLLPIGPRGRSTKQCLVGDGCETAGAGGDRRRRKATRLAFETARLQDLGIPAKLTHAKDLGMGQVGAAGDGVSTGCLGAPRLSPAQTTESWPQCRTVLANDQLSLCLGSNIYNIFRSFAE